MSLLNELTWRGFVKQVTHGDLGAILDKESLTLYCGFDPTADSLHIGSLLPIMGLAHFQRHGHRPLALVGGGTGLIGDPSGKTQERNMLDRAEVERNVVGIGKQLERFLDFTGDHAAVLLNNADWLCDIRLLDFLRDIGKHFSINMMLNRDSVRMRLEDRDHGISYTEFSYILLQSYDFLYLNEQYDCRLQVGGADQWGNIVSGMDLARRLRNAATYGLTFPLVTKTDGSKFGKSEDGNIWLDGSRTSPYKFYQFWLNQADADTGRYLRYFTFLSKDEIEELDAQLLTEPHKRAAQRALATEVTRLVHGQTALDNAIAASKAMFGGDLSTLDARTLHEIFDEVPSAEFPFNALQEGRLLLDALVEAKVFASKGEARRLVRNGGLYVNNIRIDSDDVRLNDAFLLSGNMTVIRTGKKNYHLLRFV